MQTQWIKTNHQLSKIDNLYIPMDKLSDLTRKFSNLCIESSNQNRNLLNLFEARTCLESTLTILKTIIEPEKNELINQVNQDLIDFNYDRIKEYFDNFLSILDKEQDDLKNKVEVAKDRLINSFVVKILIKSFREKLTDYMDNLVIFPMNNSFRLYRIAEKNLIDSSKSLELFEYILFRQVFISAKIKGSSIRQKSKASSGVSSTFQGDTNIIRTSNRQREPGTKIMSPPDIGDEFPELFNQNVPDDFK